MTTDTNLSRRRLLANSLPAAAAVAAMAPAAASALCRMPADDDAELLALGEQLKPLAAELEAARKIDRQRLADFDGRLAALGLKDESQYPDGTYILERYRLAQMLPDDDDVELDFDRMHDGVFALLDQILDIQPTTVEGFAVQVLAIVTAHDDLCDEDEDSGLPYGVASFFQNTCRFAGVPIPAAQ